MRRTLTRALRRLRRRWVTDPPMSELATKVRASRLTYLAPAKLNNLEWCVGRIEEDGVEGDFIEAGVALGGSAILLSSRLGLDRRFFGYDVFETIPPPGPEDERDSHTRYDIISSGASKGIGGDPYYGYVDDLRDQVVRSFAEFGLDVDQTRISLERGLFEDTLEPESSIALAHIDCDWYEPVGLCLERIGPWLSPGGFIVLDDYHDYSGCRKAVDEHLAVTPELSVEHKGPNLVLRRAPHGAG